MTSVVGLDASTTCIGVAIVSDSQNVPTIELCTYYKVPAKIKEYEDRLSWFINNCDTRALSNKNVYIEEYAKRFSIGKSTASTITNIAHFSGMLRSYFFLEMGTRVCYINVTVARRSLGLKSKKQPGFSNVKEYVHHELKKKFGDDVPTWYNRNDKVRKETYDASDALVIALSGLNVQRNTRIQEARTG